MSYFTFIPNMITVFSGIVIGITVWKLIELIRLKNIKKYFFYSLYQLNEITQHQITFHQEYAKGLKANDITVHPIKMAYGFRSSSIDIISQHDLFKILVLKSRSKLESF